ncbi:MAG TPA: hypothetical protein VFU97_08735 [Xanthobacteraceae bacterium]|nr:hypothetical protein [Xanthobacteraceae bacterium]
MGKQKADLSKPRERAASDKIETLTGQEGAPAAPSAPAAELHTPIKPKSKISPSTWDKAGYFTTLAATIALAAGVGGVAGALTMSGPAGIWASGALAQTAAAEATPSHDWVASIDEQFVKLSDRFDRLERAQAEPAARLAKLADKVDHLERHDATGSIASAPQTNSAEPGRAVVPGWILRRVSNGTASIQSRTGAMEVMTGTMIPGVGRVEGIRRQGSRWVVVTSQGMIVGR